MDLVMLATACALHGTILIGQAEPPCRNRDGAPTKTEMMEDSGLQQWEPLIAQAARRFAIPPAWIGRVMEAESGGRTTLDGRPITSPKGAMGLMQVMPETYNDMRRVYGLGSDPFDPHDNILAGAAYLRAMFDRFGGGVFAAYNAGPRRYQAYLDGRQMLPQETVSYLAKLRQTAPIANRQPVNTVFAVSDGALFFASPGSKAHPGNGVSLRGDRRSTASNPGVPFVVNGPAMMRPAVGEQGKLFVVLSSEHRKASP